jgi:magnesium-transporting ATPase (P-type)
MTTDKDDTPTNYSKYYTNIIFILILLVILGVVAYTNRDKIMKRLKKMTKKLHYSARA